MPSPIEEMRQSVSEVVRKHSGKYSVADAQLTFEIIQAIKKHLTTEYGARNMFGDIEWSYADDCAQGDSKRDALELLKAWDCEGTGLVERLVSTEVPHNG